MGLTESRQTRQEHPPARARETPQTPSLPIQVAPAVHPGNLCGNCTAPSMREVFGNGVLVKTDSPSGWGLQMLGLSTPVPLLNASTGVPLPDLSAFENHCLRVNGLLPRDPGTLASPAFHPLELQEEASGCGPTPLTVLVSGNLGDAPSSEIEREGGETISTDRVRATLCYYSAPGKGKGSWIRISGRKPSGFFDVLSSLEKGTTVVVGGTIEEYAWQERLLYRLDCRAISRLRSPATPQATSVLSLERPADELDEAEAF